MPQGGSRTKGNILSLGDKWIEVTKRATGGATFDKGASPFQDFHKVIEDRDYVIHYKAPFEKAVPSARGFVADARARLNAVTAKRAATTMRRMLDQYHRLTGRPTPDWV